MTEAIIIRDNTKGIVEIPKIPETPCDHCDKTATYRIEYRKAGRRRVPAEIYLCDFHFTRFELERHRFSYTVRMLKGE